MNKIYKIITAILIMIFCIPINIGAEEEKYIGNTLRSIKSVGDKDRFTTPYIEINNSQGYCYDKNLKVPKNTEYKKSKLENKGVENIIYVGYPINGLGLKEKYNLSDDEELSFTQAAIWYYREGLDRSKLTSKYVLELLDIADKDIMPKKSFEIDKESLKFNNNGKYLETNMITTSGFKGTFTVKTEGNVKSLDSNNNERNTFNVGESFKLRKVSDGIVSGKISIKSNVEKAGIDYYIPAYDETYQDIVVPILSMEMAEDEYKIAYSGSKKDSSVKTGDRGIFHLEG